MESNARDSLFGMGLIQFLKEHNIRFNPRPFSNPTQPESSQIVKPRSDNFVDLHLEIAQKVDALIAQNERTNDELPEFKEVPLFEDYEQTVLNPLKQELMQKHNLWIE